MMSSIKRRAYIRNGEIVYDDTPYARTAPWAPSNASASDGSSDGSVNIDAIFSNEADTHVTGANHLTGCLSQRGRVYLAGGLVSLIAFYLALLWLGPQWGIWLVIAVVGLAVSSWHTERTHGWSNGVCLVLRRCAQGDQGACIIATKIRARRT